MKNILITIFLTALVMTFWATYQFPQAFYYVDVAFSYVNKEITYVENSFGYFGSNVAAVLLHNPVTVASLQTKYDASVNTTPEKKVRVLIVPGHEPDYGGAEYGNLKERDMNVDLADDIATLLRANGHYDVIVARTKTDWNPVLLDYFKSQWDSIIAYFKDNKDQTVQMIKSGQTTPPVVSVYHNTARPDVALRLYGINKWETENNVDIAIHVHFNDNPRDDMSVPGDYSGFAVYVPEKEYANNPTSKAVANAIFTRLSKYSAVSNLPKEDSGVVEDHSLIAVGAYNTTNSASMLIEYGYIYEPQFADPVVRESTFKDLAFGTYLGLQDFFGSGNDVTTSYDTFMLPHTWNTDLSKNTGTTDDILSLQSALLLDGVYPGTGKTLNDCPRSGKMGPCTLSALAVFQKKYGIKGETDLVGQKTRAILNNKYSVQSI